MEMTLRHPRRRSISRWCERATEGAGCTGEQSSHTSRRSLFQKIECARDVGVNEALLTVRGDMRLVQVAVWRPRLPLSCIV